MRKPYMWATVLLEYPRSMYDVDDGVQTFMCWVGVARRALRSKEWRREAVEKAKRKMAKENDDVYDAKDVDCAYTQAPVIAVFAGRQHDYGEG